MLDGGGGPAVLTSVANETCLAWLPGWESIRPTAWPSPIRDRQDGSFEQQELSGRDGSGWLQRGLG